MLGIVKAGAILVNVNFRYVEGELRYLFDNSDMVALVHERQYADRVANVLPDTPNVKTVLVDRGRHRQRLPALRRRRVLRGARAGLTRARLRRAQRRRHLPALHRRHHRLPQGRDVAPRGHLPGAVRRHRLRHRRIRRGRVRPGQGGRGESADDPLPDSADDPRRHPVGHLDVALRRPNHCAGTGIRRRRGVAHDPRAQGEPAVLHRRRDGAAAARRAAGHQDQGTSYDLSSLFLLASTAALFSPSIKEKLLELLPNRVITDSIGSSETGFGGTSIVAKGEPHSGGPRVTIDHRTVVLDDDGNEVEPGSGVRGVIAKKGNIPVGYYKDEKKTAETFQTINGVRYAIPGDYAAGRGGRHRHDAGPRLGVDQQRRREDLPRRGRGGAQGPSRRVRRARGRRARPAVRPARRRRRPAPRRRPADAGRARRASCAPRSRDTKCRAAFGSSTRSSARRPASRTTGGPRSRPRRARPTTSTPNMRGNGLMRTELCDRFGIDYPIFVFTPSEKVAAAVTRAGGLGVLGCVRFNDADELEAVLSWMDENTDGKPYGVDVVMPMKIPTEGTAVDIDKLIPQAASRLRRQDAGRARRTAAARRRGAQRGRARLAALGGPVARRRRAASIRSS